MKIILGITTALLLAVFSVAYLYFSNLTVESRSNEKTLAVIPSDASIIFNFSNDRSLYEVFKEYTLFDTILGKRKKQELQWLKNFLIENQELMSISQGQKVFLSVHPMSSDSLQFLWVMPLQENLKLEEVNGILNETGEYQIKEGDKAHAAILEINGTKIANTFYIGIEQGIARGSFSKTLLLQSLNKNTEKINIEFIQEISDAVPKSDDALTSLFINHNKPGFLNVFFRKDPNGNFGIFSSFSAYSSLNLNYKGDALMFNGVTRITKKHDGYLNLFLKQKPVKNTIKRILPSNLSNAICYGLSDYNVFKTGLDRLFGIRKELQELQEQMQLITSETGVNPDRDIKKLWGNEFSNMQLSSYENLAVIRVSNGKQLQFFLEPLSSRYSETVRKMEFGNFFYYYLGDPVKMYNKPFFAVTDNLIIISNSPGTVQRFLNDYNNDRLLYKTASFTRFDQLVADQSNISFLLQFKNSESLFKTLLKKEYAQKFGRVQVGINDFYGVSYQLTSNTEHFFTNFYAGYKNSVTVSSDSLVYSK